MVQRFGVGVGGAGQEGAVLHMDDLASQDCRNEYSTVRCFQGNSINLKTKTCDKKRDLEICFGTDNVTVSRHHSMALKGHG